MCSQYEALVAALKALTQGEAPTTVTLPMAENEWYTRPDSESYGIVALDFEAGAIRGDDQKVDTSYEGSVDLFSHAKDGAGWVPLVTGTLAAELGADVTMAKRAGLLHDIGKAVTHEMEGSHVNLGVDIAKKYRESQDVIHAIQAHHGDVEAESVIACLVQAADAISAARPGARRENLEAYIKRLEKLEELAGGMKGVDKCFAFQAGREVRIIVKPEEVKDEDMVLLARELSVKIENELSEYRPDFAYYHRLETIADDGTIFR